METTGKQPYRWAMLSFLFLAKSISNGLALSGISVVFPMIAKDINLNYSQIGSVWGALPLGILVTSLIGGVAADRFGLKKVITWALFFTTVFAALRGTSTSYWQLWAYMFAMGLASGFLIPNLFKGVAMWFDKSELGMANGVLGLGGTIGQATGFLLGVPLSNALGSWQHFLLFIGALNLVVAILWVLAAREREQAAETAVSEKTSMGRESFKKVFTVRDIWLICFIEFFFIGVQLTITGVLPTVLVAKGIPQAQAGGLASIVNFASIIGLIIGPIVSDKIGLRKICLWPLILIGVIGLVGIAFLNGKALLVSIALYGFVNGWAFPIIRAIVPELKEIGPSLSGTAYGGILTFNRIGSWLLPVVTGALMTSTGNPKAGMLFCAGACIVAVVLTLFLRETGSRVSSIQN